MRIDHQGVLPFKVTEQTSRQLLVGNTVVGRVLQLLPGNEAVMQLPQGLFRVGVNADVKENVTYKMVVTELEPKLVLKVMPPTAEPAQTGKTPVTLLLEQLGRFSKEAIQTPESVKAMGRQLLESGAGTDVKQLVGELFKAKGDPKFEQFVRAQETFNAVQTPPFVVQAFHIPQLGPFEQVRFRLEAPKSEMIDADHARIVLFLETPRFGETGIDLLVQKRHVTVKVFNEQHDLSPFIKAYEPLLGSALKANGYELSRFSFEVRQESLPETFAPLGKVDFHV
ncbi:MULTISPECIES: hypothetical protein [unclassified Exiguobacterium]|uniref:hypothetical protein n=1 Tax=unclassified Exiguobacterium TaxID=2644629 RepID=UPI00103D7F85|nr:MULTISPECIES: hypothetical protein [unclassified Exiguobacterium]TCI27451.1 hypothetical protein EVJ32_01895 [Exiguobacterium sp. SH5S4]TCI57982.1 hypothetical protein EVJ30_00635 [Exiguobacterium sp. SH5S13]TCI66134.1 hypothetical protein EVJ26_00965 [Exiguobacterium sp. SH3S1]